MAVQICSERKDQEMSWTNRSTLKYSCNRVGQLNSALSPSNYLTGLAKNKVSVSSGEELSDFKFSKLLFCTQCVCMILLLCTTVSHTIFKGLCHVDIVCMNSTYSMVYNKLYRSNFSSIPCIYWVIGILYSQDLHLSEINKGPGNQLVLIAPSIRQKHINLKGKYIMNHIWHKWDRKNII